MCDTYPHARLLEQHRVNLVTMLDVTHTLLLDGLKQHGVLGTQQHEALMVEKGNHQRASALISLLTKKPPEQFKTFLECLRKFDHSHVADILVERREAAMNSSDTDGRDIWSRAAAAGAIDAMWYLMHQQFPFRTADELCSRSLIEACVADHLTVVTLLLDTYPELVKTHDVQALAEAQKAGSLQIVQFLETKMKCEEKVQRKVNEIGSKTGSGQVIRNDFEDRPKVLTRGCNTFGTHRLHAGAVGGNQYKTGTDLTFVRALNPQSTLPLPRIVNYQDKHRVNFKLQPGIQLGAGLYGKVYSGVKGTGEVIAIKKIKFEPSDVQKMKNIVDVIIIVEGISHPNLVKHFGVELHRDELLIYMEYCGEGTLEDVAGLGLTDSVVRRYTSEILQAVHVIHEYGIIHRNIKGTSIFLSSDSHLKLGDFDCAIRQKKHTSLDLVGTTAYMAPEMITQEGSCQASDIWSLGCVVIEMMTGKHPWSELENSIQILYKVGIGTKPAIPDTLSVEGQDFLSHCFEHDPKERWTAGQLQNHPFVKISMAEEENSSEVKLPVLHDGEEYHVFIFHDQDDKDRALASTITDELEQYKFKICLPDRDFMLGQPVLQSIEETIAKSHWTVAILSKSFLKSGFCELETFQAKTKGVQSDRILFIPVLYGVAEDEVPKIFRSFTCIDYNDPCFYKKLRTALTREASLSSAAPANLSGLVFSYFYGYLNLVLPGLKERVMKAGVWAEAHERFCQKLVIIVPRDCYCPGSLSKVDPAFKFEGCLPYNATRAGNLKREYKITIYSLTDQNDGQKYYCLCEFARPLQSMYEMEQGQIAGLSKQQKTHQMELFVEKLNEILNHPDNKACHDTTIILEYEPTLNPDYMKKEEDTSVGSPSLSQLVLQAVKSDIQDQRENATVTPNSE